MSDDCLFCRTDFDQWEHLPYDLYMDYEVVYRRWNPVIVYRWDGLRYCMHLYVRIMKNADLRTMVRRVCPSSMLTRISGAQQAVPVIKWNDVPTTKQNDFQRDRS
jgi:hypothetical protein